VGEAADRKVTEIDETRQRLEKDLLELEGRLPGPLRSTKSLLGILAGGALSAVVAKAIFSRKKDDKKAAEVLIRVVREDRTNDAKRR
jgi:hypothetical protein